MKQTQEQIEHLRTIRETSSFWADVAENQLPLLSKESTLQEESATIQSKIDNIKLPEIDTTELAKQGENQEATNSKILEEVQNKLTPLEAVLTELNHGKQEMVDALATKNVQSSTNKTLSAIASDVRSIAQSPITIDGGEMYEKQLFGAPTDKTNEYEQPDSPIWNLYQVMADLLSDGRFVQYGGIVLAEYPKDNEQILLEGAGAGGAYLTSDGYFYTNDITHHWNDVYDGKLDRWVAYLFANEKQAFYIKSLETSPTKIHIGRYVGFIETLAAGRLSEVVVTEGNKIDYLKNNKFDQQWNKNIIIDNIQDASHDTLAIPVQTEFVYLHIEKKELFAENTKNIILNNGKKCNVSITLDIREFDIENIMNGIRYYKLISDSGYGVANAKTIHIKGSKKLYCGVINRWENVETLIIDAEEIFDAGNSSENTLISNKGITNKVYLPNLEYMGPLDLSRGTYMILNWSTLNYLFIGYSTNDRTRSVCINSKDNATIRSNGPSDIELKHGYKKNLHVAYVTDNLTAENIALHMLDRLADNTGEEPLTLTIGSVNLERILADETYAPYVAAAQAKNWTIV